ncbi:MAG: TrmH family RNA methyltransferase [Mangrovibacterium sp.]
METNSVVFFRSQPYPQLPTKPIIAAWKIKNPGNVGSLIRLADNIGCEEVFLLDDDSPKREASIKKTAGLSYKNVKVHIVSSDRFFAMIPAGYTTCAIETAGPSVNIYETRLPEKIVFLLGSETHGLPAELLSQCQQVVHIPMTGKCMSMNVSHALAVGLFEWLRQQLFQAE